MFADVADYSEWKTGRRATGIIFATIGFALKAGLSLGVVSAADAAWPVTATCQRSSNAQQALEGSVCAASVYPAVMFAVCTLLLVVYKINKRMTLQIADDLARRRAQASSCMTMRQDIA